MGVKFFMPVEIVAQERCVFTEAPALHRFGKNAFLLANQNTAGIALQDVQTALTQEGISFVFYDLNGRSADTALILELAPKVQPHSMVIAIGGGTVIDVGKAVAVLAAQTKPVTEEDLKSGDLEEKKLPLIAVPTNAGTGAEVTPYMLLTDSNGEKMVCDGIKVYANLVLVDPRYSMKVTADRFARSTFGLIGHLIESYACASNSHRFVKTITQGVLSDLNVIFQAVLEDQVTPEIRKSMMFIGVMTGMAVSQTGVSVFTDAACLLSSVMGISYGKAVGLLLIPYLQYSQSKGQWWSSHLIRVLGFTDLAELKEVLQQLLLHSRHLTCDEIEKMSEKLMTSPRLRNSILVPTKQDLVHMLKQI